MFITKQKINKKAKQKNLLRLKCWRRLIFPARRHASIVSTSELNCRVRNGNGWTLTVIDTNYIYSSVFADKSFFKW